MTFLFKCNSLLIALDMDIHIQLLNHTLGKHMYQKFAKLLPTTEIQPALPASEMDLNFWKVRKTFSRLSWFSPTYFSFYMTKTWSSFSITEHKKDTYLPNQEKAAWIELFSVQILTLAVVFPWEQLHILLYSHSP